MPTAVISLADEPTDAFNPITADSQLLHTDPGNQ